MGSRGEAGCSAGADQGPEGTGPLHIPPLTSLLPARAGDGVPAGGQGAGSQGEVAGSQEGLPRASGGRGEAAQMPARAPPWEALAPFLPLPSTGGLPVSSAKASAGQRQGPTGTT